MTANLRFFLSRLKGISATGIIVLAGLMVALSTGPSGLAVAEVAQNSSFGLRQVTCTSSSLLFSKTGPGTFYVLPPDENYFYYKAEAYTEGKNKDSDDDTVPDGDVGDTDALEMTQWGPELNNTWVETRYEPTSRKVIAQYKGDEYSFTFTVEYRVPKSEAGQRTRILLQCNIPPSMIGPIEFYGIWASKLVLEPLRGGIEVHFDSYSSPVDEFERYEALYRLSGTSTWKIGASTTTQTTSSLVMGIDCQGTYEAKARAVWKEGTFTNAHSETYIDSVTVSDTPTGTLFGYVRDDFGRAVGGATVRENLCWEKTTTDSNGYYSFTVPAGQQISVSAYKSGYESQTKYVTVPDGGSKQLDFTLKCSGTCISSASSLSPEQSLPNAWDEATLNRVMMMYPSLVPWKERLRVGQA